MEVADAFAARCMRMRRKGQIVLMLGISIIILLTSCGKNQDEEVDKQLTQAPTPTETQEAQQEEQRTETPSPEIVEPTKVEELTKTPTQEPMMEYNCVDLTHSDIKKIGSKVYFFDERGIYVYDYKLDKTETLIAVGDHEIMSSFCIYKERIYYLVLKIVNEETIPYICCSSMEGENPNVLQEGPSGSYKLNAYEDILYVNSYSDHYNYPINPDGTLGEKVPDEKTCLKYLEGIDLEGVYSSLPTYGDSLVRFGIIWTIDSKGMLYGINPESGIKKEYYTKDYSVVAISDRYAILEQYRGVPKYSLMDLETKEITDWLQDGEYEYLDFDESGVYLRKWADMESMPNKYYYVAWGESQATLICEQGTAPGLYYETRLGMDDFSVIDGRIYYKYGIDGQGFLYERMLDHVDEAKSLGTCYYDKHYKDFGKVERMQEAITAKDAPERIMANVLYERFVFDEIDEARKKINTLLKEIQDTTMQYIRDDEYLNLYTEETDVEAPLCDYTTEITALTQLSDSYVILRAEGYDYNGGVHGYPKRIDYLFDMTSGERLMLGDVIGNSEEEIKNLIVNYLPETQGGETDVYWEDAESSIRFQDYLQSYEFTLTKDGLVVYFPPYQLAAFCYGFIDVTIPYKELNLKISVEDILQ